MSGKELLEAMSYVKDRYVEEAEKQALPKPRSIPWIKAVSLAACLCLVLLGLGSYLGWSGPEPPGAPGPQSPGMPGSSPQETTGTPQQTVPGDPGMPPTEVPSVLLYVERLTDTGFIGTVAGLVDTEIFVIGTELNVTVAEGARYETSDGHPSEPKNPAGTYVLVQFTEYSKEEGTLVVNIIREAVPPEAASREGGNP